HHHLHSFLLHPPPTPSSTLFPYTTLFRSSRHAGAFKDLPNRVDSRLNVLEDIFRALPVWTNHAHIISTKRTRLSTLLLKSARLRSEEHTSELQSPYDLVCRLLLEKKKYKR